jgi:hypothetical protein
MLTIEQTKLLEGYRDKSFIISILAEESCNYYTFIKSIISFPLIISSAIMTVMNSSELQSDVLKPINVIINALTTLLISFISNYKIAEKCEVFKQMSNKMNKLSHSIDDILTNDINNCDVDDIRKIISDYDILNESMVYIYPTRIKKQIIKRFKNSKTLPNNLTYDPSPCESINNSPNESKRNSHNDIHHTHHTHHTHNDTHHTHNKTHSESEHTTQNDSRSNSPTLIIYNMKEDEKIDNIKNILINNNNNIQHKIINIKDIEDNINSDNINSDNINSDNINSDNINSDIVYKHIIKSDIDNKKYY